VHSSLLGVEPTVETLRARGLAVDVPVRARGPLGPLMTGRRAHLEAAGILERGQRDEEVLVVRARNAPCEP
jgi:release factor glutamine methyltransferase